MPMKKKEAIRLKTMPPIRHADLAYFAGFFDGEGCVGFARLRAGIFPRVLITNTNIEILREIQSRFGGDINPLSLRRAGWKQGYSLRMSWTRAVEFLDAIYPWVRIKRPQIELVFAWNAIRPGQGRRTNARMAESAETIQLLRNTMTWLNKKGDADKGQNPIDEVIAEIELTDLEKSLCH